MQSERAEALSVLGLARARSGNPAAFGDLEEAERRVPNPVQATLTQLYLASLYFHTRPGDGAAGEPQTALRYTQEAVTTLRNEGAPSELALGLVTLVEAQLSLGRQDAITDATEDPTRDTTRDIVQTPLLEAAWQPSSGCRT